MYMYTALQERLLAFKTRVQTEIESKTDTSALAKSALPQHLGGRGSVKTALFWSHHLLATSKRKDLQHWSTELGVWTLAKIG